MEVKVDSVPGHLAQRYGNTSLYESRGRLRLSAADELAKSLTSPGSGGVVCSKNPPRSLNVDPLTNSAAQVLASGFKYDMRVTLRRQCKHSTIRTTAAG